jgi:DNA-binding transcriptional MerR regulator
MKIGELARNAQCTVETVRYYEKAGLLAEPARTEGNFRVYGPEHLERLRLIRNCRALDMSHEEIHALLKLANAAGDDCSAVTATTTGKGSSGVRPGVSCVCKNASHTHYDNG